MSNRIVLPPGVGHCTTKVAPAGAVAVSALEEITVAPPKSQVKVAPGLASPVNSTVTSVSAQVGL